MIECNDHDFILYRNNYKTVATKKQNNIFVTISSMLSFDKHKNREDGGLLPESFVNIDNFLPKLVLVTCQSIKCLVILSSMLCLP